MKNLWKKYIKFEGVQNINKDKSGKLGEIAPEQTIRIHFFHEDLIEHNERFKKLNMGFVPYTSYEWTVNIHLTAKNGNKVIKEITKSYKNLKDNIIEYKAAKFIGIRLSFAAYILLFH